MSCVTSLSLTIRSNRHKAMPINQHILQIPEPYQRRPCPAHNLLKGRALATQLYHLQSPRAYTRYRHATCFDQTRQTSHNDPGLSMATYHQPCARHQRYLSPPSNTQPPPNRAVLVKPAVRTQPALPPPSVENSTASKASPARCFRRA